MYSFFAISVIGAQFIDTTQKYETHTIDLYVPFFAILQLVFYLGWLKVAEALINPFGDDDHDFEFLAMIERHYKVSVCAATTTGRHHVRQLTIAEV